MSRGDPDSEDAEYYSHRNGKTEAGAPGSGEYKSGRPSEN
jgi:hypothetical protein